MKKSCVKYFKTRAEAEKHAASIALSDCINRFQMSGDTRSPKIIEFKQGFAIQLGDCGEFCLTTKEKIMQVTTQRVSGARYAMNKTESKDWSIQLDPSVSISQSLIDKANEYRARAVRILAEANLLETASNLTKEQIMQAIHVKYISATNSRGARIKATCAAGSVTIPYPHKLSGMEVYREAAKTLCNKLGWLPHMVSGSLPDGSYAFVFVTVDEE